MIQYILFFVVVMLSNIMQGITGFAGTILAMPVSILLVGYPVAKPILNVLGLLSGIYVFLGNRDKVCWNEIRRIVAVMAVGILAGIGISRFIGSDTKILYCLLGIFVIVLALEGLWEQLLRKKAAEKQSPLLPLLLPLAGIVHGIFVSGGPLLIGYLTRRIADKTEFRATISTIWIFLNSMVLADDLLEGRWNMKMLVLQIAVIPFLLLGMWIGGWLYSRMSQKEFMVITYILLFISGVLLIFR